MTTMTSPAEAAATPADEPQLVLAAAEPKATVAEPSIPGSNLVAMALVLVADFMLLGALIAAFFALRGGASAWPPRGVKIDTYIPTVVTVTAIMSMVSMGWAVFAVRRHDVGNAIAAMVLTVVLGLAMANLDWYAMHKAPFGIARHAYGTLFQLIIGYHLVHVAIGVVMLAVVGARTLAGHFSRQDNEPVRAVGIFWQYTNVAWLVILLSVFLISKAHA